MIKKYQQYLLKVMLKCYDLIIFKLILRVIYVFLQLNNLLYSFWPFNWFYTPF